VVKLTVADGISLWRERFSPAAQKALLDDVLCRLKEVPLYRPVMPKSGTPFSVEESNFGPLGWVSDKAGYRYQKLHPVTGKPWPAIPDALLALWREIGDAALPDCCLVNLYRAGSKMGLHQDRDEKDLAAPVVSVSLGDAAVFRIGGFRKGSKTQSLVLSSGDALLFGGVARLAYHGIDRIMAGSSRLVPGGGRLSLTLRSAG
jgi:DNA oxidative demethylase